MRRLVGVIATVALAGALVSSIAVAALTPADGSSFDLRPKLMQQLFGESSDSSASLAAAYGDRTSESPLRDLALQSRVAERAPFARTSPSAPTFAVTRSARAVVIGDDGSFDLAQAIRSRLLETNLHFSDPADAVAASYQAPRSAQTATFTAGEYQPAAPVPIVSSQSVAFSFAAPARAVAGTSSEVAGAGVTSPVAGSAAFIPTPVRLGPVRVTPRLEGESLAAPTASMNDNAYGAGASFAVRAGARNLNFDVSSNYERLTRNDAMGTSTQALAGTSWLLPNADAPLVVPNYADLSKVSLGAGVAVPVVHGLTLNLNYAADRMFGGYGMPGLTNLDATDNSYGGKLTFQIPHSASTLSISAQQLRYQDNLIPTNTSTQTREDVNLTVKF